MPPGESTAHVPHRLRRVLPGMVLALYWPALFIATHLTPAQLPRIRLYVYGRDATLHLAAYLGLAVLYWLARYGRRRPSLRRPEAYLTVALLAAYGAFDELTQALVGRQCSLVDWGCDVVGVLMGLTLLALWCHPKVLLGVYWTAMLALSHWPNAEWPFVRLPDPWREYETVFVFLGYIVLTLLWWRALSNGPFRFRWSWVVPTLAVLGGYAVFDEAINWTWRRGFSRLDVLVAWGGILTGLVAAAALAHHHRINASAPAGAESF